MKGKIINIFSLAIMLCGITLPAISAERLSPYHLYTFARNRNEQALLKYQKWINLTNSNGDTALCLAVQKQDRNSYYLLQKYGASTKVECFQKMRNRAAAGTATNDDGTFLGMGATGWTVAGVLAAGAGVAIAAGSGGGSSSHSSGGETLNCHHGQQVGDVCQCFAGYTGTFCEDKVDCSGYYSVCPAGYDKGSNTCQSGEDILYKCDVEKVCPYTTTSCGTGYHETGNTCQSGTKIYVECEANTCAGYDYITCPTGYAQSDSCQAGDIIKIKCDNCADGYLDFDGACYQNLQCALIGAGCYQNKDVCICEGGEIVRKTLKNSDVFKYEEYKLVTNNENIKVAVDSTSATTGLGIEASVDSASNALATDKPANAKIEITQKGNGNVYGMKYTTGNGEMRNAKAFSSTANGEINIKNVSSGYGEVYGMYSSSDGFDGNVRNAEATEGGTAIGIINIDNQSNGNVYGIKSSGYSAINALVENNSQGIGIIRLKNNGLGKSYGIYSNYSILSISTSGSGTQIATQVAKSIINVINNNNGSAYGMYSNGYGTYNSVSNQNNGNERTSTLEMANIKDGSIVGLYSPKGSISNSGDITIHNLGNGKAVGIYADSKVEVVNSGNITINRTDFIDDMTTDDTSDDETYTATSARGGLAIGIYGASNSNIINTPLGSINISGANTSYGIYSEGGNVTNNGKITIDGVSCTGSNCSSANNAIVLNGGKLFQNGVLQAQNLSLNSFGGDIIANSDSKFIAENEISGDIKIDNSIVQDGFDTTYKVANMVEAEDTSGLNLKSQSALFDANLENDTDAVMTMKSFDSVVKDDSVAEFLQNNYAAQNNEKLFSTLKSAETVVSLNNSVDALFGKEMFSRMTFEDISMLREINLDMNNNLFNQEKGYFALGGNVSPSNYSSNLGSIGRYSLNGYNDGKRSFAIGMSIADIRTDNGSGHNNRFDRSFVMSAPYGYRTDSGFEFITTPKLGYTNGTYRRQGLDGMNYNGNVQKRMVALMNEARYPFDFSKMTLTAALEFNAIGYNIKGSEDDDDYSLRIKSQNHASVETGFGLTAAKEFNPTKDSKLKLNGGVAFYHEFANPYELELGMNGMSGTYTMRDDRHGKNRSVVRLGLGYQLQDYLDINAQLLSNIDREDQTDASVDMKYYF